jgi:hypothetical protein
MLGCASSLIPTRVVDSDGLVSFAIVMPVFSPRVQQTMHALGVLGDHFQVSPRRWSGSVLPCSQSRSVPKGI